MLAGICHEEFYNYSDQEVPPLLSFMHLFPVQHLSSLSPIVFPCSFSSPPFTDNRHSRFSLHTPPSNYTTPNSQNPTFKSVHDEGIVTEKVILSSTKLYDVCNPVARGEWLDLLIALIEYLRSGSSKVGYLNNSVEKNMLHKNQEENVEESAAEESVDESSAEESVVEESAVESSADEDSEHEQVASESGNIVLELHIDLCRTACVTSEVKQKTAAGWYIGRSTSQASETTNAKDVVVEGFLIRILVIMVEDWGYICLGFHEIVDAFVRFMYHHFLFSMYL